eukprot:2785592-Prymnesium_polylepis.1
MEAVAAVAAVRTAAGAARASKRAAMPCPLSGSAHGGTVGVQASKSVGRGLGSASGDGSGLPVPRAGSPD